MKKTEARKQFWTLILVGYLLAQLTPQIRVTIKEEGGWSWPAFRLGYSSEIRYAETKLALAEDREENAKWSARLEERLKERAQEELAACQAKLPKKKPTVYRWADEGAFKPITFTGR